MSQEIAATYRDSDERLSTRSSRGRLADMENTTRALLITSETVEVIEADPTNIDKVLSAKASRVKRPSGSERDWMVYATDVSMLPERPAANERAYQIAGVEVNGPCILVGIGKHGAIVDAPERFLASFV